jgi:hypothetical protein
MRSKNSLTSDQRRSRFFGPEQARPFIGEVASPTEGKVPPMSDGYIQDRLFGGELRCEFELTLNGEYCAQNAGVSLDGLRLCEPHAERLWLEERVAYWRAMLAHIRLWSGEARSRERDDVVRLLEIERARSAAALERVYEELQESRYGDGKDGSGDGRAPPL